MPKKQNPRGGPGRGQGRHKAQGWSFLVSVRVLTQVEVGEIMALTPRQRAVRLTSHRADGDKAAAAHATSYID